MNTVRTKLDDRLLKKTIAQIYNKIHQEFYGMGVISQRINILDDKIIIFAKQKRVAAFTILSENYNELTTHADAALIAEFKSKLKREIEGELGYPIISILKDYDTETEFACCIIIFDRESIMVDEPKR